MSTMLKSAAMTLLSKTLQTFLYKYLLDVDVEGVNMPSILSSEVDGGGWGVRLCNVRLREGVQLMVLPGGKKKREPKGGRRRQQRAKTRQRGKSRNEKRGAPTADGKNSIGTPDALPTQLNEPRKPAFREKPGHVVPPVEREMLPTPRPSWDLDEAAELQVETSSSRPPTPDMQTAKKSMFGCFVRDAPPEAGGAVETPSAPPSRSLSPSELEDFRERSMSLEGGALKEALHKVESTEKIAAKSDVEAIEFSAQADRGDEEDGGQEEDDLEDEDDPTDVGPETILRLGRGGRIGTLDVRLVGKELHVSVEDGFLSVEACPKPEAGTAGSTEAEAGKSEDSAKGDAAKASEKAKSTGKKKTGEAKTVAERIMENSTIARLLSTIPHLFLRDCRVQVVHRENAPPTEDATETEIMPEDSVVEIGVELLSVTSGEDILAHVRVDEEQSPGHEGNEGGSPSYTESSSDQNDYLVKRIRTGRGPEGGIWMKVFPPGTRHLEGQVVRLSSSKKSQSQWAHKVWLSSADYCFFRCSGLDVRARIYLGKREDESDNSWALYDEFAIDTMLYTVDYIAPGPAPPSLPPLERGLSQISDGSYLQNPVTTYQTDVNGIQSSRIPSNFHRVARGLLPSVCNGDHLPCETCAQCWDSESNAQSTGKHSLDSSTPLPGLVFSLCLNDPLEVNIDRPALDVLGEWISLFRGEEKDTSSDDTNARRTEPGSDQADSMSRANRALASLRDRWGKKEEESLVNAYPSYMQPERIEILGVHMKKVVARIHVMRAEGVVDNGLSFCYWDTVTRCVTMDSQTLSSEHKSFRDTRFDVGELSLTEYKGAKCTRLMSIGQPHPDIDDSDSASNSSNPQPIKYSSRPAWPNTASVLLNIRPPLETTHYESRERHGLQLRYMSLLPSAAHLGAQARSRANIRFGVLSIDMPYQVKADVYTIMREASTSLFGRNEKADNAESTDNSGGAQATSSESKPSSLMKYKIQVDGGNINLPPVVSLKLPLTKFTGGRSSDKGLFFETLLNHVVMEYGARSHPQVDTPQQLSLAQMAALPETIRMRIVLFLKDLGPVERAFRVKRESNTFLRCRAVNKGFVKQAKRNARAVFKKSKTNGLPHPSTLSRRQQLLGEIMKLDDSGLEDLWQAHQKSQRRHRKTQSGGVA